MLENILVQMGLNQSFFLHFVLFACLMFFLKFFFFNPLLRHLYKRDEKTTLLAEQINELKTKSYERIQSYQREKSKIQRAYAELLNQYQRQASEAYREIILDGRSRALGQLGRHRENLAKEYRALSGELVLSLNDIKKSLDNHLC